MMCNTLNENNKENKLYLYVDLLLQCLSFQFQIPLYQFVECGSQHQININVQNKILKKKIVLEPSTSPQCNRHIQNTPAGECAAPEALETHFPPRRGSGLRLDGNKSLPLDYSE